MDVLHILRKQRETLGILAVEVEACGPMRCPRRSRGITLRFQRARGAGRAQAAARGGLAVEKYCSAIATLSPSVQVSWQATRQL